MKNKIRRGLALGLALALTATAASASYALGWDVHKSAVPIAQGTEYQENIFWSDTYSDLRTEYVVSYTPSADVVPTVAYGDKILTKATLSAMAQSLESQGKRVVSGLNGDWYVVATGATTGLVVTDGVVRATPYYSDSWAIGFQADGTAFIAQTGLTTTVTFGGTTYPLTGAINKVRMLTENGVGGLTLLTSDFASTTQNTQAGVDVVLTPVTEVSGTDPAETPTASPSASPSETPTASPSASPSETPSESPAETSAETPAETSAETPAPAAAPAAAEGGTASLQPVIGGTVTYQVEQVLESAGSIAIPEGKAVLTLNGGESEAMLAALRALQPGDTVTLSITAADSRWNTAVEALGGVSKILSGGQVVQGLDASRTAWSAVGLKADGTVVFYAVDGKQPGHSVGATVSQVAQRLAELGCVEALSMDGGGSTTMGVSFPDQSGMTVTNQPSDGSQRANSTAIFLTTTLRPTGELAGYYLTPGDDMLLAGASLQLSAVGLDSACYTMAAVPSLWTVTEGGGTVDQTGLFTAGTESGFVQVTAGDGAYSGTACLTVVKTPDSISLSDESTGAALTALNLDPGQQVDLKAQAVYRKLALTAQDSCFTWSVQGDVGTVDQNGLFTAGTASGSGTLTVSAGGTVLTVPVSVAGHVKTLADWESGDLSALTPTDTVLPSVEAGLTHVHNGRQSLRLDYQAGATGSAVLEAALPIAQGESWLSLWVYGDGSGNALMASFLDGTGAECAPALLTALDFTGWRYVQLQLPEGAASLARLTVVYGGGEGAQSGVLWLDQLVTSNEKLQDAVPPTAELTLSGTALTAVVKDDVDKTLPQSALSLSYDGTPVEFTWQESAGVLTAALPAGDGGWHRVTLTAWDASGNQVRTSVDVTPAVQNASPFGDMAGHWAQPYADFLYVNGISQGTGGEVPQYQPDRSITRAEFFAMTAHWLGVDLSLYSAVELPFADAGQIPDWALNEIKAMYSLGLLQGADSASGLVANPLSTITRAEAITLLGRTQARGYAQADLSGYADAGQVADWALEAMGVLVGQGVVTGSAGQLRPSGLLTRGEVAKLLYAML